MATQLTNKIPQSSKPPRFVVEDTEICDGAKATSVKPDQGQSREEFITGMREATGVTDSGLMNLIFSDACNVKGTMNGGRVSEVLINTTAALMHAIKPQNALEALLMTQMINTHALTITMMGRAVQPEQTTDSVDRHINRASKLMRIFNTQLDTLQRMRGKGQQKITVEHVNIGSGGQAVVGDVTYQGGG